MDSPEEGFVRGQLCTGNEVFPYGKPILKPALYACFLICKMGE